MSRDAVESSHASVTLASGLAPVHVNLQVRSFVPRLGPLYVHYRDRVLYKARMNGIYVTIARTTSTGGIIDLVNSSLARAGTTVTAAVMPLQASLELNVRAVLHLYLCIYSSLPLT